MIYISANLVNMYINSRLSALITVIWSAEIVPISLALIVYELVSLLTLIADDIVLIGLALIVYELVSL